MKLLGIIGTTGLFLLLGTTTAYAAQDKPDQGDKPEKQEAKPKSEAKPAAKSEAKTESKSEAKPEAKATAKSEAKSAKQEPQDKPVKEEAKQPVKEDTKAAKQADKPAGQQNQQKAEQSKNGGDKSGSGAHGRISDDHYRASFGSGHNFHVNVGDYNSHRFNYGGYSFGFVDAWPEGWYYTDDVYVVYDDGAYYMYDVVHPGIRISVNIL